MRIRELTIRNYRVHAEPPPFQFSERFTVVAGINGKGKTALLDGLALLCSRFLPLVSPARSGYRTIAPSEVHLGSAAATLGMKVTCAGIPLEYTLTYDRERRKVSATKLTAAVKREVRMAYGDPARADDAAPLAVYYTTDRAGYRIPKKLPPEVPRGQAAAYAGALFNRTVNFRDFMARYRSAIALERDQRVDNPSFLGDRAVNAISRALTTFLGGFGNLRVQEEPLRLLVDKDGVPLDLSQLSDGERSFLALICDLGRRLALANPSGVTLENPLHGAGVVLIDELELHLHPKWQLDVAENLRATFPNIQFIATTHSPFILQTAREGEVITLDRDLAVEPAGKNIEEVARLVMGVTNTERSPRYQHMLDSARRYLELVEEARSATAERRAQIHTELVSMLAPFSDNPAYTALLERRGLAEREP
jgi:predicted ATP-binding protein involved in virulence